MSEPKILIDCRDAALGYEGRPIWEHLSFRVRRGDYLCIVGDNGSGKSTLLKSLLGLNRLRQLPRTSRPSWTNGVTPMSTPRTPINTDLMAA